MSIMFAFARNPFSRRKRVSGIVIYTNEEGVGMSDETISAEQIEGLEELITEILNRKTVPFPSSVEDIEQLSCFFDNRLSKKQKY